MKVHLWSRKYQQRCIVTAQFLYPLKSQHPNNSWVQEECRIICSISRDARILIACHLIFFSSGYISGSRSNVVGLATRIWAGRSGVRFPFLLSKHPDRLWGLHSLLFSTYLGYFPGVERPRCEVNHSPPSNAEVKNVWSYAYAPSICHHGVEKEKSSYGFRLRKFNTRNTKQILWTHTIVTYRHKSVRILTWHLLFPSLMSYATTVCRTESVAKDK
jgi:hypothetical protein